jgi:flagellar assembly protein FliH
MLRRALFAEQFDDAEVVARTRRGAVATAAGAAIRFCYPELAPPSAPPAPPAALPRTFGEDELARALEQARDEAGAEAAARVRAEVTDSLEHRRAEALGAIAAQLSAAGAALERTLAARVSASRDLALALARALVPRALELQPLADIESMLRDLLLRLEDQPWLEIGLPPELLAGGEEALARVAAETGYQGELRVLAEPALGPGAARVRWREGAAGRELARIEAEAMALVDAWLPNHDNQAPQAPAQPEAARTEETET